MLRKFFAIVAMLFGILMIGALYSAFTPRGVGGYVCGLALPRVVVSWNPVLAAQWDKQYSSYLVGVIPVGGITVIKPTIGADGKIILPPLDKPETVGAAYSAIKSLSETLSAKLDWDGLNKNDLIAELVKAGREGSLKARLDALNSTPGTTPEQTQQINGLRDAIEAYLEYQNNFKNIPDYDLKQYRKESPENFIGYPEKI